MSQQISPKKIILATDHLVKEMESESLEISGLEDINIKMLLEIIIESIGSTDSLSHKNDLNRLIRGIIIRSGLELMQRSSTPEKIMAFLHKHSLTVNRLLKESGLVNTNVTFKRWIRNDIVVSYIS